MEYRHLKTQYAQLQDQIRDLDSKNLALSRDIRLIQSDSAYVEKMVRQKLHYLRDNEMVYLFSDNVSKVKGEGNNDGKN